MTSLIPGKRQITSGQLDRDTCDKVKGFVVSTLTHHLTSSN
jgi:hypothetical protein